MFLHQDQPDEYYYHNNYYDDEYYSDDSYLNDDYYYGDDGSQSAKKLQGRVNHNTAYKNSKKKQPTQHELYMTQKRPREKDNQQKRRTMSFRSGTAVNKTVASNTQGSNKRKQRKIRFEEPITDENFDPQSSTYIQQDVNQQRVPQVIPVIQRPPIKEQPRNITPVDHYQTPSSIQTTININEDTIMLEQPSSTDQRPRPLKRKPRIKPEIEYDIVQDIANITAQIKIQAQSKITKRITQKPVTCLYDTGAAKSCISRTLMDDLEMEIHKSSSTRFTLGNGAIQASQGIIKDVEIQIGNFVKIPITLEVLTDSPVHLILGNNWMHKTRAIIDFGTSTITLKYNNQVTCVSFQHSRLLPYKIPNRQIEGIKTTRQIKTDSSDADGDTEETDEETTDDTEDYTSFESDYTDSTSEEDDINENQDPIEFYLKDDRVKYPLQLEEWIAPNGTTCYHVYTGESLPLTGNETTYLTGELPCTNSQELRFYPYPALYQPYDYQETSPIIPGQIRVEIKIDNPCPDPIELPYNAYLGDYMDIYHTRTGEQEEELDDDEIAEIYGYDYDPYRYTQLRRQGATNDQDLFMLHEGIPVQQSLIILPRPGAKVLEIWTKEDLIIPNNRSIYYHGKLPSPNEKPLRFEPEKQPGQYTHHYYCNTIPAGSTTFTISIQNIVDHQVIINDDTSIPPLTEEQKNKLDIADLPEDQDHKIRNAFFKLIQKYQSCIDWDNTSLSCTNVLQASIDTGDAQPIRTRPYKMSPEEAEALKKELNRLCRLGVIEPSKSPWSSPIILLKKKGNTGEYRLLSDLRRLNTIAKSYNYPLPNVEELLSSITEGSVFSCFDLRQSFFQVPLEPFSRDKTTFTTKYGNYRYTPLRMGYKNSPHIMAEVGAIVFRSLIGSCVRLYIDDVCCYSKSIQKHLSDLEQVFECLKIANLKVNIEKCSWFKTKIKYLGHYITPSGIHTDPDKTKAIQETPIPTTQKQLQSFLGCSFNDLKTTLIQAPILSRHDYNKDFYLITDGSKFGLGGTLSQLCDDGKKETVICYLSRSTTKKEESLSATGLECAALVYCVQQRRHYLLGKKFHVVTDHQPLSGYLKEKQPIRRHAFLSKYDFTEMARKTKVQTFEVNFPVSPITTRMITRTKMIESTFKWKDGRKNHTFSKQHYQVQNDKLYRQVLNQSIHGNRLRIYRMPNTEYKMPSYQTSSSMITNDQGTHTKQKERASNLEDGNSSDNLNESNEEDNST
ncbi:hypothetical protein INT45_004867, partial [Circinella minor]